MGSDSGNGECLRNSSFYINVHRGRKRQTEAWKRGVPRMLDRTSQPLEYVPGPSWGAGPRGTGMAWPGRRRDMTWAEQSGLWSCCALSSLPDISLDGRLSLSSPWPPTSPAPSSAVRLLPRHRAVFSAHPYRLPCLGAPWRTLPVQYARHEPYHVRGWYCRLEKERGRVIRLGRRAS